MILDPVVAPFPWQALTTYLGHRLILGIERIDSSKFERTWSGGIGDRRPRAGSWSPSANAAADLSDLGMPTHRVQTLRALAAQTVSGDLDWRFPWTDLRERLARVPGIGPWTFGYLGIRLGRAAACLWME